MSDTNDPARGERGRKGRAGGPGEAGERGRTGDVGRVGDTGKTGDTGAAGEIGKTGAAGQVGDTGAAGLTGATGPPGDVGAKGPGGQDGEHQRAVVEETLRQVRGRQDRRLLVQASLVGFLAALVVMVPVSIVVGGELASVGELQKVAKSNCDKLFDLTVIFEEDERAEAAATQQFLKTGNTFGLSPKELKDALAASAARDAVKIASLQRLARSDCPGTRDKPRTTTTNVTTTPPKPRTTPKAP